MSTQTITDPCADTPAPTICNLITKQQTEREHTQAKREAYLQERIAAAKQFAETSMGALWDELAPLRTGKNVYDTTRDGALAWLRIELDADKLAALDLAPFHLRVSPLHRNDEPAFALEFCEAKSSAYASYALPLAQADEFFYAMRQRVLDDRKKERQVQIDTLKVKLDVLGGRRASNTAQADAALAELVALDPANADTHRASHAALLAQFERNRKEAERVAAETAAREEADQQRAAAYQQLADQYRAAYQTYWDTLVTARAHNVAVQERYQAELDTFTFEVWKLTYALVAENDDGRVVETETCYLLNGYVQNQWGEYQVLQPGGEIVLRRFAHDVSRDAPETWKPSEHRKMARPMKINSVTFYLSPEHSVPHDLAEQICAAWKSEQNQEPEVPQDLREYGNGWFVGNTWIESAGSIRKSIADANPLPKFKNQNSWSD